MIFLIYLFISISFAQAPFTAEGLSQRIYLKAAEKNSFPPEILNVPTLRWACEIELGDERPPKSCSRLLQLLESLSGQAPTLERKYLQSITVTNQKKQDIQRYKRLRQSGTSDE